MKKSLCRVPGVFLCLLLLAACASDRDDEPSGFESNAGSTGSESGNQGGSGAEPSGPAFDALPELLAELLCAELEGCLGADLLTTWLGGIDCVDRSLAQIEDGDFLYVRDAIDAGRVTYYPDRINACLEAIDGLGCDFHTTRIMTIPACDDAFEGTASVGDECAVGAECEGNMFCKIGDSCPGTCTALLDEGEDCDDDDDCQTGLACSDDTNTCFDPAREGEPCEGSTGIECDLGLLCVGADEETDTPGSCKAITEVFVNKEGDSCDLSTTALCEAGLSCVVNVEEGNPRQICAPRVASGEACSIGAPSQCPDGEYCAPLETRSSRPVFEGTCRALPGEGESCPVTTDGPACQPGLICDTDDRCHAVNRIGEPCVSDDGCLSEICEDGRCARPINCEL